MHWIHSSATLAYTVFNIPELRVGVRGVTTEDTRKRVHPDNIQTVQFRNAIEEASTVVPDTAYTDADVLRAYVDANSPLKAEDCAPGDAIERR